MAVVLGLTALCLLGVIGVGYVFSDAYGLPTVAAVGILLLAVCRYTGLVSWMILKFYSIFVACGLETWLWSDMYDLLLRFYPSPDWKMLNHGFAGLNETGYTIELSGAEEFERYSYQLYHHIGTGLQEFRHFRNLDVMEVGCGRGGGLAFLYRYMSPTSALGVDIVPRSIAFCKQRYRDLSELKFIVGDAGNLPVASQSRDLIIDICSSHCYSDFNRYLAEVVRVLRPEGRFFIADFRPRTELLAWENALKASGLTLEKKEDITEEVEKALKFDSLRREKLIRTSVVTTLQGVLSELAGVRNSTFYKRIERRDIRYMAFKLFKP
jgi:ubiquinone/menaquinone biosynthesis C-methylase UbiE